MTSGDAMGLGYTQFTVSSDQNQDLEDYFMAAKKNEEVVTIRPIAIKRTKVRIVGDTPLIVHAWSDKAKQMMLDAQTGKKKGKEKPKRVPAADFVEGAYWLTPKPVYPETAEDAEVIAAFEKAIRAGARFGFPATAIKQAANSAAYRLGWVKNQMGLRGAWFIDSDESGLVEIHSDPPVIREDMVRVGMGTADLRYRPQFNNWHIDLDIQYNEGFGFDLSVIINALNAGGFTCGIGEWRPEKDGNYGRFHVEPI